MTTPSERSRAFIAGLELMQDLLDRTKTPRVPTEVRERARRVLRHYPTASELLLALETVSGAAASLGMPVFDAATLESYLREKYPRRLPPAPLPPTTEQA